MGWEAQCGADLRHLLHAIQHLPMDPHQAVNHVAPLAALCNTRFACLPSHPALSTHPSDSPRHLHRSLTEGDAKMHQQRSPVQAHSQTLGEVGGNSSSGKNAADDADAQQQRPASVNADTANGLQNGQEFGMDLHTGVQQDSTSGGSGSILPGPDLPEPQELGEEESKTPVGHDTYEPGAYIEPAPPRSTSDDAPGEILTHQQPLANDVQQAAAVLDQAADEIVRTSQDSKGDMVAIHDRSDASLTLDVPFLLTQPDIADASNLSH